MWGVVLIAVIAASFAKSSRTEIRIVANETEAARARALADGGIYLGIAELIEFQRDRTRVWDGSSKTISPRGGTITLSITDESGKVDLNTSASGLLRTLFVAHGVDPSDATALEDAILDWRDADNERRPLGAESQDYGSVEQGFSPKNGPFSSIDDLRHVRGIDDALFKKIAPAITVHSGKRGIDPMVAPEASLLAILGSGEEAHAFIEDRGKHDSATARSIAQLGSAPRRYLTSSSRNAYSIRAEARTENDTVSVRLAVVGMGGDQGQLLHIYDWRTEFDTDWAPPHDTRN